MPMEPMIDKWQAFGWEVVRIDGHNLPSLLDVLAPQRNVSASAPRMIVADTIKGKGVSFMENVRSWHADLISSKQYSDLVAELGGVGV